MSKPSLTNANFKRFMRKPELRIEKAQSLYDLLEHTCFGVRCHLGKLSIKVKAGVLIEHQYTQGKKK